MAKLNKTCTVCGTKYSYCPVCSADNSKPSWMNMFCSENCKDLFQAATDYYAGELEPGKAKVIVEKSDLSNKENFKPSVQKFIDALENVKADYSSNVVEQPQKEEKVVVEEVKAEEVKIDSEPSDEVVEASEQVEEANEEKKLYGRRNKKNR